MKQILFLIIPLCLAATASAQTEVEADSLRLDSLLTTMPEVMVKGERPLVRAEAAKLIYDLPRLVEDKAVNNVFEALKYLPGVTEQNETLSLGGRPFTVIIDDKPQALTAEQLAALLKAMPVGRLKDAEVMLSAPPQYGVRGAAINLHLRRADGTRTLQGEAMALYRHRHYDDYSQRASLLWQHNRSSLDFLYQHDHGRTYSTTDKEARHTLLPIGTVGDGSSSVKRPFRPSVPVATPSVIPLTMHQVAEGRHHEHQFRLGFDHDFSSSEGNSHASGGSSHPHRLSVTYYASLTTSHSHDLTTGSEVSSTQIDRRKTLHDLRLDYHLPFGLTATAELTDYQSPATETLSSELLGSQLNLLTGSRQHITRYRLHLDQTHSLPHAWTLNYGVFFTHSRDHSRQDYAPLLTDATASPLSTIVLRDFVAESPSSTTAPSLSPSLYSLRREHALNLYATLSHSFSSRLMASASLATEHYVTPERRRWDFYPTLNLTYLPADGHTLQLAINTDKNYPDYWALQNTTSYMGRYSEVQGTPNLRPCREYSASLQYILKNKYIASLNYTYTDDYFVQLLYQSPRRLVEIYRNVNFRYRQQLNLRLSAPLKVGTWLNARLTFIGARDAIRIDDYFTDEARGSTPTDAAAVTSTDAATITSTGATVSSSTGAAASSSTGTASDEASPLLRTNLFCMAVLNATFTLPTPTFLRRTGSRLHLILDGFARTAGIQGLYDLPASGNLDLKLRATFLHDHLDVTIFCRDLFETGGISPRIDYTPSVSAGGGSNTATPQYVVNRYSCFRSLGVTLSYRFGGYKEKKREAVDTSRFR